MGAYRNFYGDCFFMDLHARTPNVVTGKKNSAVRCSIFPGIWSNN